MRDFASGIAGCAFCFLVLFAVKGTPLTKAAAARQDAETKIVTDQTSGVVKIVVQGREVARFDRIGLHVRNNVEYGGYLMDYGQSGFNSYLSGKPSVPE